MKNFSKVLALILVVATLFSFVAMTASAKEFEDSDKISYAEAVDVLSNIGIIDGYTNDTFRPANNIKRSEMAKMIAVLSNAGKDDMGDLYAAACKFADVKDNSAWAKSYIAYCNQKGIVAGRNATTFDPEGKVTGIETAKMLLVVMGFDAETQGYVGTGWKTHVLADADKVGLLDNFAADFEPNSAITREEAAQMMLNALEAPMVIGTLSDNIVKISNNIWLTLNGIEGIVNMTLTDAARLYDAFVLFGNVVVSPWPVYTSFTGLSRDDGMDCYGNPVTRWSMENTYGKEIWSSSYEVAPDFYYTTAADLEGDLDILDNQALATYTLYVDGQQRGADNMTLSQLITTADGFDGKGVETKVYLDTHFVAAGNNEVTTVTDVTITVKNTYIGEVEYVTKAANTFTLTDGRTGHWTATPTTFDNAGYGFEEGDIILYWLCNESLEDLTVGGRYVPGQFNLHAAEIAVPVNVDLTDTYVAKNNNVANSYIMGSTKKYEYAFNFGNFVANATQVEDELLDYEDNKLANTYDLYLDKFGYMMAWDKVENEPTIGYMYLVEDTGVLNELGMTSGNKMLYKATANTYDFDAKLTTADNIDRAAFMALANYESGAFGGGRKDHGVLIRYKEDANGRKNLDYVSASNTGIATLAPKSVVLDKDGRLTWYGDGVTIATADNKTQFLIRTPDYVNGGFKYEALTKSELTMNYCGSLENITDKDEIDNTVVANIQYFYEEVEGYRVLTYVFVNALYAETSTVRAFVIDETADISADAFVNVIGDYTAYDAFINGERAILALTENHGDRIVPHGLYQTKLTVIGLTHNNVPVYANVTEVNPVSELANEACWYERNGVLYFHKGTAKPIEPMDPTSDFFAVVCIKNADGSMTYDTIKLDNLKKLNDYVDTVNGVPTFTLDGGYDSARSWAIYDGHTVSELYLYITVGLPEV